MALIQWDARGLCVAIAQDRFTGAIRMVAWMNEEALAVTRETKRATFFSRSRNRLWTKGEESGNHLAVHEIVIDCDGDSILLLVDPAGPSCHTGQETCFFERLEDTASPSLPSLRSLGESTRVDPSVPLLSDLAREIESRRASDGGKSYTKSLLDGGAEKIGGKLREEADELARAIAAESPERVASEAADVLYHLMVGLASRDVSIRAVLEELARRRGVSGHAEKRSRSE